LIENKRLQEILRKSRELGIVPSNEKEANKKDRILGFFLSQLPIEEIEKIEKEVDSISQDKATSQGFEYFYKTKKREV